MPNTVFVDFARRASAPTDGLASEPAVRGVIPLPPPRPEPSLSVTAVLMSRDARSA